MLSNHEINALQTNLKLRIQIQRDINTLDSNMSAEDIKSICEKIYQLAVVKGFRDRLPLSEITLIESFENISANSPEGKYLLDNILTRDMLGDNYWHEQAKKNIYSDGDITLCYWSEGPNCLAICIDRYIFINSDISKDRHWYLHHAP